MTRQCSLKGSCSPPMHSLSVMWPVRLRPEPPRLPIGAGTPRSQCWVLGTVTSNPSRSSFLGPGWFPHSHAGSWTNTLCAFWDLQGPLGQLSHSCSLFCNWSHLVFLDSQPVSCYQESRTLCLGALPASYPGNSPGNKLGISQAQLVLFLSPGKHCPLLSQNQCLEQLCLT